MKWEDTTPWNMNWTSPWNTIIIPSTSSTDGKANDIPLHFSSVLPSIRLHWESNVIWWNIIFFLSSRCHRTATGTTAYICALLDTIALRFAFFFLLFCFFFARSHLLLYPFCSLPFWFAYNRTFNVIWARECGDRILYLSFFWEINFDFQTISYQKKKKKKKNTICAQFIMQWNWIWPCRKKCSNIGADAHMEIDATR